MLTSAMQDSPKVLDQKIYLATWVIFIFLNEYPKNYIAFDNKILN